MENSNPFILRMTVVDEDTHCHEPLGEIRVALKKLRPHQPNNANLYLEKPVRVIFFLEICNAHYFDIFE